MSFLKKLFGGFGGQASEPAPAKEQKEAYRDLVIVAKPVREGAQFRLAGRIEQGAENATRSRTFVRADLFTSESDAIDAALRKGKQIINEQGNGLFKDEAETRNV
ncbi:transcriptional activator HlyU [Rhizobium sp. CFBP 8762]|uniref:HlyU family transcriptional regulator n=1 Tax=Rhizobium sp. CFBP 8762 TaxID=2775279 RepID=UPI0017823464|nr:HlyU family transcriptional regulator [Rhizobium sp. CFBP 8762]MBD8555793.1 transcriptional activator HlyU [Rhizobium sp. CFBP 8762]